ncbi:CDP-alcohol phosphatidyltransferase family protein [Minwuia sp.]|uniref:CDP-alcohol phosphatidyltransferase family protein n=1 Tax=Minwuia sp. TaxID=2493630 RepID=UPI003A8D5848
MKKTSRIKLRHIAPSLVTIFAICAGLTSVRMSLQGHLETALYFILLAVFLDAVDGKLARYLDSVSLFGAELDTLADFFNFGIAPGILLFNTLYIGTEHANLGWLATLLLAACCALRLARFNLSMKDPEGAAKKSTFFVGVPAPALACLALLPIFIQLQGWSTESVLPLCAIYTMGVGFLAVSTVPTFSIKYASIKRSHVPVAVILSIALVTCLMVYPWPMLIAANLIYLVSMPFSYLSHRKQAAALADV